MTLPISPHTLVPIAVGALILWRVARRVRRLVGRQPVRPTRLTIALVVFPLLVALIALTGLRDVELLMGLAGGVAVGAGIGVVSLRMTRYEVTPQGLFYTPHTGIGVALSLLFVLRVLWRFGTLYLAAGSIDPRAFQSFGKSPLTLAVFGLLAGYYIAFAIGILAWRRRVARETPAVEATPQA